MESTVGRLMDDADVSCVVVVDDMTGNCHGKCAETYEGDPTSTLVGITYVSGLGTPVAETGLPGNMMHWSRDRGCGCESYAEKGPDASKISNELSACYSGSHDESVGMCACMGAEYVSPILNAADAAGERSREGIGCH